MSTRRRLGCLAGHIAVLVTTAAMAEVSVPYSYVYDAASIPPSGRQGETLTNRFILNDGYTNSPDPNIIIWDAGGGVELWYGWGPRPYDPAVTLTLDQDYDELNTLKVWYGVRQPSGVHPPTSLTVSDASFNSTTFTAFDNSPFANNGGDVRVAEVPLTSLHGNTLHLNFTNADPSHEWVGYSEIQVFAPNPVGPQWTDWKNDASGNWSDPGNWTKGVPNAARAAAMLGTVITQDRTVTLDATAIVGTLGLNSDKKYTLSGPETLTLQATAAATIDVTGQHAINAPITLESNVTVTVAAGGSLTLAGSVSEGASGAKGIAKSGDGTLVLSGTNNYGGTTTVNGGVLQMGSAAALGNTSGIAVTGGTLDLQNYSPSVPSVVLAGGSITGTGTLTGAMTFEFRAGTTVAVNLAGTASLTKSGGGTLVLSGKNTYSGLTEIKGGTLQLASAAAVSNTSGVTVDWGARLDLAGQTIDRAVDLSGFGNSGDQYTGTGGLFNSDTMNTAVINESLTIHGDPYIGGPGNITVKGPVVTPGAPYLAKVNTGVLRLEGNSAAVTGWPRLALWGGTVVLAGGDNTMPPNITLDFAGPSPTLVLNDINQTITRLNGSGTAKITLGSGTFTFSDGDFGGVIEGTGGIVKQGGGTAVLSGANTFTGTTKVDDGVLQLGTVDTLLTSTLDTDGAGTVSFGTLAAANLGGLTGSGPLDLLPGFTLTVGGNGRNTEYAGSLSGGGIWLIKKGPGELVLSGSNTCTGALSVNEGTLSVPTFNAPTDPGPLGQGTDPITLGGSGNTGTLRLTGTDAAYSTDRAFLLADADSGVFQVDRAGTTLEILGPIGGNGSLQKTGDGALWLSNSDNYLGGTTVSGGTLKIGKIGALPAGSALTIASGGTVILSSGLSVGASAGGGAIGAGRLAPVPEPGSAMLLVAAVLAAAAVGLRRRMNTEEKGS